MSNTETEQCQNCPICDCEICEDHRNNRKPTITDSICHTDKQCREQGGKEGGGTMIHITELEAELLLEIAHSDFSSDGYGFSWCYRANMGYYKEWMAKMRGCMTSLKAKGVISVSVDYDACDGKTTWVGIYGDYLRDATDEEKAVKDSIASWTGKCYANLDRRICRTPKPIYGQPLIGIENKENDEE